MKHDQGWYNCDKCDLRWGWNGTIYNHIQDKHRNEKFYCEQCQYKTKRKANLEIHLVKTHKNSKQSGTKFIIEKICVN